VELIITDNLRFDDSRARLQRLWPYRVVCFNDLESTLGSTQSVDVARGKFPAFRYEAAAQYFQAYRDEIIRSWATIDPTAIASAVRILEDCLKRDGVIYACGNGGSAAIANHLACDFQKGIQTHTAAKPRVVSLSANLELITAIGNDIGYEEIFAYQLSTMARRGDVLMTFSASGNSENIVRAVSWAKGAGVPTIALVGFTGGRSATMADVTIHVAAENYGTVEDVHQSMMHFFAQYLRQLHMSAEQVAHHNF
jgi:D-sedoheptulose 7-phosphate isomerase